MRIEEHNVHDALEMYETTIWVRWSAFRRDIGEAFQLFGFVTTSIECSNERERDHSGESALVMRGSASIDDETSQNAKMKISTRRFAPRGA